MSKETVVSNIEHYEKELESINSDIKLNLNLINEANGHIFTNRKHNKDIERNTIKHNIKSALSFLLATSIYTGVGVASIKNIENSPICYGYKTHIYAESSIDDFEPHEYEVYGRKLSYQNENKYKKLSQNTLQSVTLIQYTPWVKSDNGFSRTYTEYDLSNYEFDDVSEYKNIELENKITPTKIKTETTNAFPNEGFEHFGKLTIIKKTQDISNAIPAYKELAQLFIIPYMILIILSESFSYKRKKGALYPLVSICNEIEETTKSICDNKSQIVDEEDLIKEYKNKLKELFDDSLDIDKLYWSLLKTNKLELTDEEVIKAMERFNDKLLDNMTLSLEQK